MIIKAFPRIRLLYIYSVVSVSVIPMLAVLSFGNKETVFFTIYPTSAFSSN